jgi:serine/threonine-protein kinase
MSTVYRATDTVLGRVVAVKLLPEALAEHDPMAIARFEREARAAAALSHPSVVAIYDTGSDGESRFIVMEFVEGRSLAALLREQAPVEPRRAARIAAGVADALAAAHAAGIVHRDIKPANVMLSAEEGVKVLDFGIARALEGQTLTQTAAVIGTAAYMAPERASGQAADQRSDIYSLGCMLYAMLAGEPPFAGEMAAAVLHQQVNAEPPPLRARSPAVPPALAALIESMLEKDPARRPASAGEVRDRLEAVLARDAPAGTPPPESTAPTRVLPAAARKRRPLIFAAAAGALTLLIVAIALGGGGGGGTPTGAHRHVSTSSRPSAPLRTTTATVTTSGQAPASAPATPAGGHHHGKDGAGPPGHEKKSHHG